MALETKSVNGKTYFYYRYYYRLGGEKRYEEEYLGADRPTKKELLELKARYRETVSKAKAVASESGPRVQDDWDEEEDLPVYLL